MGPHTHVEARQKIQEVLRVDGETHIFRETDLQRWSRNIVLGCFRRDVGT